MITLTLCILVLFLLAAQTAAGRPRISPARERVVQLLDRGLAHSPMRGTGRELEAAGHAHHIHPAFIAAIAATESSLGIAACNGNPRNAFGLSSCHSGWTVPYFRSWAHAYTFMAVFLTSGWPHARSTWDYFGYAANASAWGTKTAYWMRRLFNVGPNVRYE